LFPTPRKREEDARKSLLYFADKHIFKHAGDLSPVLRNPIARKYCTRTTQYCRASLPRANISL
jgi:hypothetical protein